MFILMRHPMTLRLTPAQARKLFPKKFKPATKADRKTFAEHIAAVSPYQQHLFETLSKDFPGAVADYRAIPGRRFSVDIAWPDVKVAVEVDGWTNHGKYLGAHARDRTKRNLLVINGWRVLAFPISQIRKDPESIRKMVDTTLQAIEGYSPPKYVQSTAESKTTP